MLMNRMHADEAEIDDELVRRLVAAQFPQWAGLAVSRVASSGTENAMFRLGGELVVRLPRLVRGAAEIGHEQRWLRWLAPRLPVAVPEVLGEGRPGEGFDWDWSVLRWLPGVNPDFGDAQVARDLGAFVKALRGLDTAGAPEVSRGRPLHTRDAPTRDAIAQLGGDPAYVAAWEKALAAPEWAGDPVWLHADLSPGNVLVDDGGLTAVLDFAGVGIGDPAVDVIPAWNTFAAAEREVFREAVDVDDATWERGRGWALSIALIQLPYYRETNPVLAANARRTIEAVLED